MWVNLDPLENEMPLSKTKFRRDSNKFCFSKYIAGEGRMYLEITRKRATIKSTFYITH